MNMGCHNVAMHMDTVGKAFPSIPLLSYKEFSVLHHSRLPHLYSFPDGHSVVSAIHFITCSNSTGYPQSWNYFKSVSKYMVVTKYMMVTSYLSL